MSKPPVSEQVQVNFRMPADLRDRIKMAADRDGVSMNHVIITTLEEKYPAPHEGYRQLLSDVLRLFEDLATTDELSADAKLLLEKVDALPEKTSEEVSREIAGSLLDALDEKFRKFNTRKAGDEKSP